MDKSLLFYVENINLSYRFFSNDNYTSSDASIQHCGILFRNFRFYRFSTIEPEVDIFRSCFLILSLESRPFRVEREVYRLFLNNFRFYRFFADKTGSGHFSGMVPNLFIKKSTIARQMRGLLTIFR